MGDNARGHAHGHHLVTTWGRVPVQKGESESRSEEAARSNRSESLVSVPVTPQWCAQEAADQAARAPWPPVRWLPTWSRVIMKVCSMLLAAVSAPRV